MKMLLEVITYSEKELSTLFKSLSSSVNSYKTNTVNVNTQLEKLLEPF